MAQRNADLLIAGGGIAGLTLALLLAKAGLDVHLADQSPPENMTPSGRTVALMESSLNVIRETGIWDKIASSACPMKTMRIIDDSAANGSTTDVEFHSEDIGLEQFGYNIPNNILRQSLYEAAQKSKNIILHTPDALESYTIEQGFAEVTLKSGKTIKTKLIAGADGRNSTVRRLAEIEAKDQDYGQSAITCLISHSRPHDHTATEFHRPGGPLALVPMPGNQSSVVWIEKTERAQEIIKLRKPEFTRVLQERSLDILGEITLETGPECWPLKLIKASTLSAPRVALLAEAAHVISPVTAQGLNLSLRDVATLAETIVDAMRAGLDPGDQIILRKYEKRRMMDINTRVFGVDSMNRIVSHDFDMIKGLRRAGLKGLDFVTPLKKTAMRIGLAPNIDLGRLTKGESL